MNTKSLLITFAFLALYTGVNAQTKIGASPTTLGNGQLLELETSGTRAGFKLASVALTSATDVSTANIATSAVGTMVYNIGSGGLSPAGIYVWTGSAWQIVAIGGTAATIGDVKTGIQSGDHNGWIRLDGRAKTSLSSTQQAQATALGIGANLPNATNAYLAQNGAALGSVSGTNLIAQSNLPNVNLTAASAGDHAHGNSSGNFIVDGFGGTSGDVGIGSSYRRINTTTTNGAHTHSVPLNGGVAQVNYLPRTLSVNTFIYLGN